MSSVGTEAWRQSPFLLWLDSIAATIPEKLEFQGQTLKFQFSARRFFCEFLDRLLQVPHCILPFSALEARAGIFGCLPGCFFPQLLRPFLHPTDLVLPLGA